jgi:Ca2+:H+ antiporter
MDKASANHSWFRQLLFPLAAWAAYMLHYSITGQWFSVVLLAALVVSILQGVHHAEVIAHKIGEPFGTLVLALAVTCIEASLIISLMSASGPEGVTLARDTVFAAVMIILTAMIGMSLLVGGWKYGEQTFLLEGANATVTTLIAISVLTLVLPNFTQSLPGPYYNTTQLFFVAMVTLILYGSLLFVQNFKHRDHFVEDIHEGHADEAGLPPGQLTVNIVLMVACLAAVVFLAKSLSPALDRFIDRIGAPQELAGVIIAAVILVPEGLSAYKASTRNQLQKSLNLSLGSALASISLTMPVVSIYAVLTDTPISLGIDPKDMVLLFLTLLIVTLALKTGRTTILQGIILLVIFLVYLFTIIVP